MNKKQLAIELSKKTTLTLKESAEIIQLITDLIQEALVKGDDVILHGFGNFKVRKISERAFINPQTKQAAIAPPHQRVTFLTGKTLKKAINSKDKREN